MPQYLGVKFMVFHFSGEDLKSSRKLRREHSGDWSEESQGFHLPGAPGAGPGGGVAWCSGHGRGQEPILWSGSVAQNLDPTGTLPMEGLMKAVSKAPWHHLLVGHRSSDRFIKVNGCPRGVRCPPCWASHSNDSGSKKKEHKYWNINCCSQFPGFSLPVCSIPAFQTDPLKIGDHIGSTGFAVSIWPNAGQVHLDGKLQSLGAGASVWKCSVFVSWGHQNLRMPRFSGETHGPKLAELPIWSFCWIQTFNQKHADESICRILSGHCQPSIRPVLFPNTICEFEEVTGLSYVYFGQWLKIMYPPKKERDTNICISYIVYHHFPPSNWNLYPRVHTGTPSTPVAGGLSAVVEMRGNNFSLGQRQLCFSSTGWPVMTLTSLVNGFILRDFTWFFLGQFALIWY